MIKHKRIRINPAKQVGNSNISLQYELQKASWIWHSDYICTDKPHVLNFRCTFYLEESRNFVIHLSADHRYELCLDKEMISRGPDRCDLFHWSFASYEINLSKGKHEFNAKVWWIGEQAPAAQESLGRGGFIFASEGRMAKILNTGEGDWKVCEELGWSFVNSPFSYIGAFTTLNASLNHNDSKYTEPSEIFKPLCNDMHGQISKGWRLIPTSLPEQNWTKTSTGKIRAIYNHNSTIKEADTKHSEIADWQKLIINNTEVTVQANSKIKILIDLEDYYCGYPELILSSGKNSEIKTLWAESLYKDIDNLEPVIKENRSDIIGKYYYGKSDTILHDGLNNSYYRNIWWRSGRYILIDIQTEHEELIINAFNLIETGYPLKNEGVFISSDKDINDIIPLAVRGMQMCSHETFMDCPYYEQLMYVGDSRLEMLITYIMSSDDRLVKRGIELFDWSRHSTGFVHERYPSNPQQISVTFSMIWIAALKDYTWWRSDSEWIKERIVGMRCLLENIMHLRNTEGLLEALPGWSFVDWVPEWKLGLPADASNGISSIINLFFVMALKSAADIERSFGNLYYADYYEKISKETSAKINELFWDKEVGLLADDLNHTSYSEHAQCLALIYDVSISEERNNIIISNLLTNPGLHRTTVYFSFYLLETLFKYKKGNELIQKLEFWKQLQTQGFKTPVEAPEPSRSDCHAWGSHPLFHFHASIAGIRPDSSGFKTVKITPNPGSLEVVESQIPHPNGKIKVDFKFDKEKNISGTVRLPDNIKGKLIWKNKLFILKEGKNIL